MFNYPPDQLKYLPVPKNSIENVLDADLRRDRCDGADHSRLLAQVVRLLRKALNDNGPTE
jgi:hypothetical protein